MDIENVVEQVAVRVVINGLGRTVAWAWPRLRPSLATGWHGLRRDLVQYWRECMEWPWPVKVGYVVYITLFLTVGMWEHSGRAAHPILHAAVVLPFLALAVFVLGVKTKRCLRTLHSRGV